MTPTFREQFLSRCSDGRRRTVVEIRSVLGLNETMNVTQALHALKTDLIIDREPIRLRRAIVPGKHHRAVWWIEVK